MDINLGTLHHKKCTRLFNLTAFCNKELLFLTHFMNSVCGLNVSTQVYASSLSASSFPTSFSSLSFTHSSSYFPFYSSSSPSLFFSFPSYFSSSSSFSSSVCFFFILTFYFFLSFCFLLLFFVFFLSFLFFPRFDSPNADTCYYGWARYCSSSLQNAVQLKCHEKTNFFITNSNSKFLQNCPVGKSWTSYEKLFF